MSEPLYLLPNQARLALAGGFVRLEDHGKTWTLMSLRVGEPGDFPAFAASLTHSKPKR